LDHRVIGPLHLHQPANRVVFARPSLRPQFSGSAIRCNVPLGYGLAQSVARSVALILPK
jgi:hypothetical protein